MNYCEIKPYDIANGEGVRVSLFVSGCDRHCKGCFNPSTWDLEAGKPFTAETVDVLMHLLDKPYIQGLSILGGEPFHPANRQTVSKLCRDVKFRFFDKKDIWLYTGYTYEDIFEYDNEQRQLFGARVTGDTVITHACPLLPFLSVIVDGPFIEEQKDISLKFKGSSNQRIIDVKQSLEKRKIVNYTFK